MEKKRVLIVEDNPDWLQMMTMVVQRAGYDAIAAKTGIEAVEKAFTAKPDLVLMDIGLPFMNGSEATEIIKANPATKDIPIVIQTAYGRNPLTENAVKAGAVEVLEKPFQVGEILRVLSQYLSTEAQTNHCSSAGVIEAAEAVHAAQGRQ